MNRFFMSSLLLAAGIQDLRGVVAINVGLFLVIMIGMVTGGKLLDTFGRRRWTREYLINIVKNFPLLTRHMQLLRKQLPQSRH